MPWDQDWRTLRMRESIQKEAYAPHTTIKKQCTQEVTD
jgi:hypothetical protein